MTLTPGPNNIMSMNNAKNVGFKKAIKFNFGILVGSFFVLGLCLLFSSILYNLVPTIQFPMKILGAAYLLYLIIKTLIPSKEHKVENTNGSFLIGIVLQLINPKLILFGITVMSSYILPYYKEIPIQILFLIIITIIGFTATLCWALSGSLFSMLFTRHKRVLDIIMAVLLLYCAVSLFI
jgi:threonine/homoserine/homoserine lactone efflux protein